MFISERHRRRRPSRRVIAAVLGVVALAIAAFIWVSNRNQDVHNGTKVEFNPNAKPKPKDATTQWPFYHYDLAHTAYLPSKLKPPFRVKWSFRGHVLMEFPTTVAENSVFFVRNNGSAYRVDSQTGAIHWKRQIGSLAASTPAYWRGMLFFTTLSPQRLVALRARDGKRLWQMPLQSRSESSPIVHQGVLYFGTEGGGIYAVYAKSGRTKWRAGTGGAVKGSPALVGGTLYVGDYSGRMYALWARNGHERWSTGTSGSKFGFASGQFYSTPAVGFGRVFAGNTDGKVYSFGTKNGELAWSKSTGGYVYSSPAIVDVAGVGPTVYIGSYDGTMYALDARTGNTRWTARPGGRISGGVTVIGKLAYWSDLDSRSTFGANVRSGRIELRHHGGAYNPATSDGKTIYITGYNTIDALEPARSGHRRPKTQPKR